MQPLLDSINNSLISALRQVKPIAFGSACAGVVLMIALLAINSPQLPEHALSANIIITVLLRPFFLYLAFALLLICVVVFVSPLGRIRIGGDSSIPLYSPIRWFAVSLTTVIAMGILFWAVAEPIIHFREPPPFFAVEPGTPEAARSAMVTLFTHWTLVPYAIYTTVALTFALAFYNQGYSFSVDALLRPILGKSLGDKGAEVADGLVLFSSVVGMAAVLCGGLLLVTEGLRSVLGAPDAPWAYGVVAAFIVVVTLYSAGKGLKRGIGRLAVLNTLFFLWLIAYLLVAGPSHEIVGLGVEGLGSYFSEFIPRHLMLDEPADSYWSALWTATLLASWFAWAPLTCLFLGKIARGYTIRQFIVVNLFLPSAFAVVWFSVFSVSALHYDTQTGGELYQSYQSHGLAAMVYQLLSYLPAGPILSSLFILVCLISFITAADSNMDALGSLSTRAVTAQGMASPFAIKCFWCGLIGLMGWYSAAYLEIEGIRLLASLAGFTGVIIVFGSTASLMRLLHNEWLRKEQGRDVGDV